VFRNNHGFTLIEVLVSLVILMVMMMAILQTLCVALQHNMQNQLRNEGVRVADTEMAREMSKGFDNVSTVSGATFRSRRVMNALRNYSVSRSGSSFSNSKTVTFEVSWYYKNNRYTHSASSAKSTTTQQ
jgi:type IV pilus assembly protein PilV